MTPQTKFRHGRIVWAYLRSSRTGRREKHPAVILSDDADIVQPERFDPRKGGENTVYVIGVSTKYRSHALPYVPLPYEPRGHPVTRLTHDCAAIVGWYHRVCIPDDVLAFGGEVPPDRMRQINDAVRQDLARKVQAHLQTVADMLGELLPEDGSSRSGTHDVAVTAVLLRRDHVTKVSSGHAACWPAGTVACTLSMNPSRDTVQRIGTSFLFCQSNKRGHVVKTPSVLFLATLVLQIIGCNSANKAPDKPGDNPLHSSENVHSVTAWENFDQAEAAFNKIVPHKTRVEDLKALGFDPHTTPNIKVLNYLDIIQRFIPNSSISKADLHPDVRSCIEVKEACMGYELDLDIIRKKRFGSLALDMTGFKKETQIKGWDYKALLLIKDGVVVYKLRSGRPSIDKIERKINPLGPVQEVDNLVDNIPGI